MSKKNKDEEAQEQSAPAETAGQEVQTPKEDYYDQLIRLKADFENYRKRIERERPLLIELGKEKVIEKFLPVYDAMLKAEEEVNKGKATAETLKSGLELVFKELQRVFDGEGVKAIDCIGQQCNYELHDVIAAIPSDKKNDGKILEEVQKGFTIDGRVLRHSKVCVGKCEEAAEEEKKEK